MTKHYVGKQLTLITRITNSGTLIDPTTVKFTWRIGRNGSDTEATVTNTSVGVYQAIVTPDKKGMFYGKWESDGVVEIIRPVRFPVHDAMGIR